MRDFRSSKPGPPRTIAAIGAVSVGVLTLTLSGCAKGASSSPSASGATATTHVSLPPLGAATVTTATGGGSTASATLDLHHTIRIVNLATVHDAPGPALDVYAANTAEGAAKTKPVVVGLAYGQVSDPFHPGAPPSDSNAIPGVTIYAAGAHPGVDKPVLTKDIDQSEAAKFVLYLHGTPNGGSPSIQRLAEVQSTTAEVVAPAATAGKVTLSVDTQAIGDEGDTAYPANYFTFGPRNTCLKGVDDQNQSKATAFKGGGRFTFTLDPGATDLGFWLTTATLSYNDSDLTCQGTELAAVDVSHLTAGSLAWVFLFGPTATNLRSLVVPILS